MDTFLDDQQTTDLAEALRTIAADTPELLRIARREASPPGGKAARNPRGYASRPPVNLNALSLTGEVHNCVGGWTRCLADDRGIQLPDRTDTAALAIHLQQHIPQIAACDWAEDAHDEITDWARAIRRFTTEQPDWTGRSLSARSRGDILEAAEQHWLLVDEVIELHFHLTGQRLTERQLRSWRGDRIQARKAHGRAVYWYPEVRHAAFVVGAGKAG